MRRNKISVNAYTSREFNQPHIELTIYDRTIAENIGEMLRDKAVEELNANNDEDCLDYLNAYIEVRKSTSLLPIMLRMEDDD